MRNIISLEIASRLPEEGFSLDELVYKSKVLFETQGIAGFVALLLKLQDASIVRHLLAGTNRWQPEPCCEACLYEICQYCNRTLKSSIGNISFRWHRIRCKHCRKTFIPLRDFLGLKPYQRKSSELERIVTEVISDQSYRRTCHHLDLIGSIPVPRSTAHRWVMESDCDELRTDNKIVDVIIPDGTGYKRRPDPKKGLSNRGEVRVVIGIRNDGEVLPFGAWSGKSWAEIGQTIRRRTFGFNPIAKLLLCDGEGGLAEGLAHLANDQQRSHFHGIRDLNNFMWQDKAPLKERRQMQKQLTGIIGIELPEEDFQEVQDKDKAALEKSVKKAETEVDELAKELKTRGYTKAANYVANTRDKLFTYVRFWLKYGLISPRATSMIERMMREIGRRLKRIAFGWSEKGAAKMTRIIIKRITNAAEWDEYWRKRLRITGNLELVFNGARVIA